MSNPLVIPSRPNRSVRGTDDHILFRAANPYTGRISPSIAGSPPRASAPTQSQGHRRTIPAHSDGRATDESMRVHVRSEMTAADYARLAQGFAWRPRLPRTGALYGPREQRGIAQEREHRGRVRGESQTRRLLRGTDEEYISSGNGDESVEWQVMQPAPRRHVNGKRREVPMRKVPNSRPQRKSNFIRRLEVKDEDRLRGSRVARAVQVPISDDSDTLSVIPATVEEDLSRKRVFPTAGVDLTAPNKLQNGDRNAIYLLEPPCMELRRLGALIPPTRRPIVEQDAIEEDVEDFNKFSPVRSQSPPSQPGVVGSHRAISNLRHLPSVRLVPPCLARIPLSHRIQYAQRRISGSGVESDNIGTKEYSSKMQLNWWTMTPDFSDDDISLLTSKQDFPAPVRVPAQRSGTSPADHLVAVLVVVGTAHALAFFWSMLPRTNMLCGELCWLLPD